MSSRSAKRVVVMSAMGTDVVASALRDLPGVEVVEARSEAEVLDRLEGTTVLVMMNQVYSAGLAQALHRAESVRLIQLLTAGYDRLESLGVPAHVRVATAGPSRSPAVAEHTMALLLAWVRGLPQAHAAQARGHWSGEIRSSLGALLESTLLIVGFGSIGQELAARARAFGTRVEGINRSGRPHPLADRMYTPDQLPDALGAADFVVLTLPSTAESRGLFGATQFAAMKRSAVLVNVARGDIVDTEALTQALRSGQIRAAALDVFEEEPLPAGSALWEMDNVLITPHVGGISGAVGNRILARFVAENVGLALSGQPANHLVAGENFRAD
ncbi:MAG: D-2-hydroxyacid dehydrogenase [Burkholderiaceae bacterium]|nr:D-2-hydroxyacid dehydrogenase [Burkholderiaceae bacterium]